MSTYTPPALNAVNFGLTAATPDSTANPSTALSAYSPPALAAVAFALVAYTLPTFLSIDFELGDSTFPTQYSGLRIYNGAVVELCLVATADAPTGDCPRIRKGGTTYAVYLVDTSDPNASPVRIRTNDGTKAVRLKV